MSKKHDDLPGEGARDAAVRGQRIEELFREELNSLLDSETNDPALEGTRITLVELSRDGSRARIWFAIAARDGAPNVRNAESAFARASGFLRSRLCEALFLKRMPELRFRFDPAALLDERSPDGATTDEPSTDAAAHIARAGERRG
jgi:ribosome-binding factor A